MRLNHGLLALVAAAVAAPAQVALPDGSQPIVSMRVTTPTMVVGYEAEPFQCAGERLPVYQGDVPMIEIFGLAEQPYILFAGTQAAGCTPLPWCLGELGVDAPILILEAGIIPLNDDQVSKTGLDRAVTKIAITSDVMVGVTFALQAVAFHPFIDGVPAFTRPVNVFVF